MIPDIGISVSNAEAFMNYSMVFPGIYEDEKVLFIPAKLINIFIQTDGSALERVCWNKWLYMPIYALRLAAAISTIFSWKFLR